jgi:hypothetical protein
MARCCESNPRPERVNYTVVLLLAALDREQLLRPFFSDHADESLNPSRYGFSRGWLPPAEEASIAPECVHPRN